MNAAGNADVPANTRTRIYLQVALTLTIWLVLFTVLALSVFSGTKHTKRWVYDCAALSSLVIFVISVAVESIVRRSAALLATSSVLLTATYYVRLFDILLSSRASVMILPLTNIIQFEGFGSSVVALDLGQVSLCVLTYLILSALRGRSAYKTRELNHQGMR